MAFKMLSERGTKDSEKWSQERAQPEEIEVEGKNSWSYKFLGLIKFLSTATGVLVTPKHYFFFNAGDSRTILVRNSKVEFASMDHKPTNPEEKKRIEEAGGRVMIQRINGSLAVSRALGQLISSIIRCIGVLL